MAEIDYLRAVSYGEILPGYQLLRTTREANGVPAGALVLTTGQEPEIVITAPVLPDPGCDNDGEDRDLPEEEWVYEIQVALGEHMRSVEALEEALRMGPMEGYHLVQAAVQAGYDPGRHGSRFASWLAHRIAVRIETVDPQPLPNWLDGTAA